MEARRSFILVIRDSQIFPTLVIVEPRVKYWRAPTKGAEALACVLIAGVITAVQENILYDERYLAGMLARDVRSKLHHNSTMRL